MISQYCVERTKRKFKYPDICLRCYFTRLEKVDSAEADDHTETVEPRQRHQCSCSSDCRLIRSTDYHQQLPRNQNLLRGDESKRERTCTRERSDPRSDQTDSTLRTRCCSGSQQESDTHALRPKQFPGP